MERSNYTKFSSDRRKLTICSQQRLELRQAVLPQIGKGRHCAVRRFQNPLTRAVIPPFARVGRPEQRDRRHPERHRRVHDRRIIAEEIAPFARPVLKSRADHRPRRTRTAFACVCAARTVRQHFFGRVLFIRPADEAPAADRGSRWIRAVCDLGAKPAAPQLLSEAGLAPG